MKNNKVVLISLILLISLLGLLIFQGCEKEKIEQKNQQEFLTIDGELNDLTLSVPENNLIYLQAADRFREYLDIKKGQLVWSVSSGQQLNISESIFDYLVYHFEIVNSKIVKKQLIAFKDLKGDIRISKPNLGKIESIVRLKTKAYEFTEPINLNGASDQLTLTTLWDLYMSGPTGNMTEYVDMGSVSWTSNGMDYGYISGYGMIDGQSATFYFCNGCFDGNYDCSGNDIGEVTSTSYSDRTHYFIKDCSGRPLITITIIN